MESNFLLMKDTQSLLVRITCLFWITTKLFSYRAWFADGRLYPVVPPFEFLDTLPPIAHSASFFLSLAGLGLLIIFPRKVWLMAASFVIILFSCLLDVMRWQPWEYQCLFFLLLFIINRNKPAALFSAIIFVMGSIYIYSGIHKFNGGFLCSVWENLILRRLMGLSWATIKEWHLHYAGLILPVVETMAGILLLMLKNKKIPLVILMIMHLLLLFMLSGSGMDKNRIVLPWNIFMLLILYFYYYKGNQQFSMPVILRWPNLIILLFWGILPAFNFVGLWEKKFSSSLYSGKARYLDICIRNPQAVPQLREHFQKWDPRALCDGQARISLYYWSAKEMRLLPYPEDWYFKKFKKKWEKLYPDAGAEFKVYQYPYKVVVEIE